MTQVQHLLRQAEENATGGRHRSVLRRAIEQWFTDFRLQPANCLTDSRLRAVEPLSGARETLLLRYRDQDFKLVNIHFKSSLVAQFAYVSTKPARPPVANQQFAFARVQLIGLNGQGYIITSSYEVIDIITLTISTLLPNIESLQRKETREWPARE
jgi:hypothetical protein